MRRDKLFLSKLLRSDHPEEVRLDMYLDASGSDNWSEVGNEWHIISCVIVWNSVRWGKYREWYDSVGGLHASNQNQLNGLSSYRNTHDALAFEAPEFCMSTIAHVPSLVKREQGFDKTNPFSHSNYLWGYTIKAIVSSLSRAKPPAPIRRAFFNNPGGGRESSAEIRRVFDRELGASFPIFERPGTDPGIALADAMAWGNRRWLLKGHSNQFPPALWGNQESRYSWCCLLDREPVSTHDLSSVRKLCGLTQA